MELIIFYSLYVMLIVASCGAVLYEKKVDNATKWKVLCIFILLFSFLMALRPLDVPDTRAYLKYYYMNMNIEGLFSKGFKIGARYKSIEYVFLALVAFFRALHFSYRMFLFVVAIAISLMIVVGLESCARKVIWSEQRISDKSIDQVTTVPLFMIWTLFLICFGLLYAGVAIRAGLSMGIGMMAIKVFLDWKTNARYIAALFIAIAAALFQTFGIIYVPIIIALALKLRLGRKAFIIVWIIFIAMFVMQIGGKYVSSLFAVIETSKEMVSIDAFNTYISDKSALMRKKDLYRMVIYGLMVILAYKDNIEIKKYAFLCSVGIFVMAILYPVGSVYRIADYLLMFAIPVVAMAMNEKSYLTAKDWCMVAVAIAAFPIQMIIVVQG